LPRYVTDGTDTLTSQQPKGPLNRSILGVRVDATSYPDATERIVRWARAGTSKYVCIANVNNVMQAHTDPAYLQLMNEADLVTPDGMPLVWGLRMLGLPGATQVCGPDLMPALLTASARQEIPIGFLGSTDPILELLDRRVRERMPELQVAYSQSPPFREMSPEEDARTVQEINASGARLLFVGLGCPKQERWMAEHRGKVNAVMVGVGAAFDFLAGTKRRAPRWMKRAGLEWSFRLAIEPRRLWRRYLLRNPAFVALFFVQVVRARLRGERSDDLNGKGTR
jgi:N-acetylglucosaminyldiphosphoundecaprenol N-acetyl-beta-D-mannosaminyltransferase